MGMVCNFSFFTFFFAFFEFKGLGSISVFFYKDLKRQV